MVLELEKIIRKESADSHREEEFLTSRQAADLLNISASTLKRKTKQGEFRSRRIGNILRYKKSALLKEDIS